MLRLTSSRSGRLLTAARASALTRTTLRIPRHDVTGSTRWAAHASLSTDAGDGKKRNDDKADTKAENQEKQQQQQQQKEEAGDDGKGFFARLREEVENDPNVKKTLDELKQGGGVSDKLNESADKAKEQLKQGSEAFEKRSADVKQAGENVGEFFDELKNQFGLGGLGRSKEKTTKGENGGAGGDAGADGTKQGKEGEEETGSGLRAKLGAVKQAALSRLPDSFANDDRSWDDALKAVFGVRVPKKNRRGAGAAAAASGDSEEGELEEWFEAVDKETGDRYYYNSAGETVWEKPTNAKIVRAPEEEAHDFVEQEKAQDAEPSFLEKQIAEKAAAIGKLEDERDAAMAESDMARFKELNGEIRAMRKDIERLSAQANTTAVVHVEEKKGAWEKFNENLREAPLLKSIFGMADSDVARKARDAAEDAREVLETSQNPMVYRMYSVYDSMFGETEMGEAIREFRRLDPEFTMETFVDEVQYELAPTVISAFLKGDLATIEDYCSEGAGAAVKHSIKDRQAAGRKMDEHILSIGEIHVAAAKVVDKMGPMIVTQFMVQQINCLYNLKGEVVEGKEDEIVGVFYIFALTLDYDEETAETRWRIKEFAIGGTTPWI